MVVVALAEVSLLLSRISQGVYLLCCLLLEEHQPVPVLEMELVIGTGLLVGAYS